MSTKFKHLPPSKPRIAHVKIFFFRAVSIAFKIFGELPEEHINFFSDLWKSPNLDKDDKQMIWKYFDIFVACAQGHKKMQ